MNMPMSVKASNKKKRAMLLMVITACMWSIGGLFIKLISWSPFMIAGVRSAISGSIMAIYMKHEHVSFKLNLYSFFAGVGLSFSATLFTVANKLTTAANAIVLQYTAPVFILILSAVLFHQKLRRREIAVVAVTLAGMVMFFLDQLSPGNVVGNLLGILAGVFLALMFVMVGRGGDDDGTRMSGILIAHTMTFLIGVPLGLAGVMAGSAAAAGASLRSFWSTCSTTARISCSVMLVSLPIDRVIVRGSCRYRNTEASPAFGPRRPFSQNPHLSIHSRKAGIGCSAIASRMAAMSW